MKIMPEAQQKEIAEALKAYVSSGHKMHHISGLCYLWRHTEIFNFHRIRYSYGFFDMFPIGNEGNSGYIGGQCGYTSLRKEFAGRLSGLLLHPGIYIESSEKGNFLRADGGFPGSKNAREWFFRWVRKNT
jgi:hypothetical protein